MKTLRAHPLHLFAGLVIWAVWYVVLYGGQAVGCELAPPAADAGAWTWLNGLLLLHTLVFAVVLLYLTWLAHRSTPHEPGNGRFILRVSTTVYLVSTIAILVIGSQNVIYPPCV